MSDVAAVRIPASTSNLGAGFDCIGMAVPRWLEASARLRPDASTGALVRRSGTLAALEETDADDLLVQGFVAACAALRRAVPGGLAIDATSDIPIARGLGSSAAALVAGAALADELLGLELGMEGVASVCARVEGHGDNAGSAALGGAVLGVRASGTPHEGVYLFRRLVVSAELAFAFAVPDFPVSTSHARALLPRDVPRHTAVDAAAKAAALVRGLETGDAALLRCALDDVLHVPFRRGLIRGWSEVTAAAEWAGAYGATLSGSGSTLVAVAARDAAPGVADAMCEAWERLGVRATAMVVEAPEPV